MSLQITVRGKLIRYLRGIEEKTKEYMKRPSRLGVALSVAVAVLPSASLAATYKITVNSGSINAIVGAQPAGTLFLLACGTYRNQAPIQPKSGDSFIGAGTISGVPGSPPCADLNGSVVLSGWTAGSGASAHTWYETVGKGDVNNTLPSLNSTQPCNSSDIGCEYQQDLFFNSVPKTHVTAHFPPLPGQWYLDYRGSVGKRVANTVYVGDNPNGSTVELSVSQAALTGSADKVTIQNLTIEKYATALDSGAVTTKNGDYWNIENNWLDLNHGEAISLLYASDAQVTYNRATKNGQTGIGSGGGADNTFSNNVTTQNNFAGVYYTYAVGGGKFSGESGLKLINNTVSNNNGNGLWGDGGDTNALFSGNTVEHNLYNGIAYEISYSATITRNTLVDNAQASAGQCIAAHIPILAGHDVCTGPGTCAGTGCAACTNGKNEIWVHTSADSTVGGSPIDGNTITSDCAGIQIEGDGRLEVEGNAVTYNTLRLHTGSAVINTVLGGSNDTTKYNLYTASPHNYFDYNSYTFDNRTASRTDHQWDWALKGGRGNETYDWANWPQDPHGSVAP